jgi:DtxR family Mn-dependent transcriptional regulator
MTDRILHEDALKHVQKLDFNGQAATLESVSGALEIDSNRAVEIIMDLESRGLLERSGDRLHLTSEGGQVAMNVIRAHRLWEHYLAEHTGYRPSEWHAQAERIEHDFTPDQVDQLAGSMGNPLYDPHGDPIPSKEGEFFAHDAVPLVELEPGTNARIVHIEDEPETVAAQIEAEGLLPGMHVRISERTAHRVRFWTDGEEHILAPIVAANISVQALEDEDEAAPIAGISLDLLSPGQQAHILQLSPRLRGAERRRLLDLGMLPGTLIQAELSSPMGDPVAYRVRESVIALRKEQACCIQVERIEEKV